MAMTLSSLSIELAAVGFRCRGDDTYLYATRAMGAGHMTEFYVECDGNAFVNHYTHNGRYQAQVPIDSCFTEATALIAEFQHGVATLRSVPNLQGSRQGKDRSVKAQPGVGHT